MNPCCASMKWMCRGASPFVDAKGGPTWTRLDQVRPAFTVTLTKYAHGWVLSPLQLVDSAHPFVPSIMSMSSADSGAGWVIGEGRTATGDGFVEGACEGVGWLTRPVGWSCILTLP